MSDGMQYAIFRVRDAADYPDPFESRLFPSREAAESYKRQNYRAEGWKWLEIRERPAPAMWKRCEP